MSVILRARFLIILIIIILYNIIFYNSNNCLCALYLCARIRDRLYENCYYYFIPILLLLFFFKSFNVVYVKLFNIIIIIITILNRTTTVQYNNNTRQEKKLMFLFLFIIIIFFPSFIIIIFFFLWIFFLYDPDLERSGGNTATALEPSVIDAWGHSDNAINLPAGSSFLTQPSQPYSNNNYQGDSYHNYRS